MINRNVPLCLPFFSVWSNSKADGKFVMALCSPWNTRSIFAKYWDFHRNETTRKNRADLCSGHSRRSARALYSVASTLSRSWIRRCRRDGRERLVTTGDELWIGKRRSPEGKVSLIAVVSDRHRLCTGDHSRTDHSSRLDGRFEHRCQLDHESSGQFTFVQLCWEVNRIDPCFSNSKFLFYLPQIQFVICRRFAEDLSVLPASDHSFSPGSHSNCDENRRSESSNVVCRSRKPFWSKILPVEIEHVHRRGIECDGTNVSTSIRTRDFGCGRENFNADRTGSSKRKTISTTIFLFVHV